MAEACTPDGETDALEGARRLLLILPWIFVALAAPLVAPLVTNAVGIVITLIAVLGCLGTLGISHGPWSSSFLAAVVLAVFHFGALPAVLGGQNVGEAARVVFFAPVTGPGAMGLSLSGLSAFTVGCLMFPRRHFSSPGSNSGDSFGRMKGKDLLATLSAVATVVLIATWLTIAIVLPGINPFTINYLDFLAQARASWILQPLGLFFVWTALDTRSGAYKWATLAFVTWGAVVFLMGLRGEVLFPAVAHVAVAAASRKMPSFKWVIPALVVVLMASSLGREIRDEGLGAYRFDAADLAVTESMTELGFSQYVVEVVYGWHEVDREPYYRGATYTAPVERMLGRALGLSMVEGEQDFRLMNVEIGAREGQIGGSVIAEALHNFGRWGVPVILLLWGALISLLRARVRGGAQRSLALEGLVLFLFLWHVRNSFVPLPLQTLYALVLVHLCTARSVSFSSSAAGEPRPG